MPTDTTPAAVDAMIERLERIELRTDGDITYDAFRNPDGPKAAAMLRAVARERDKTRAAIESQASAIRNLRANEESEINILRSRSRDHYIATVTLDSEREANAHLTDALLAAEAEAAAMLREMALERDRYRELASTTHRANMVSMGEADKLKDRIDAAEAEAAALREALREIDGLVVMEINPSNYNHDDVCELSRNASYAAVIARAALKETSDGL